MDKNLRNEKKFIFYSPSQSIEKLIESLGAEYLYPQRKINSIYFDSIYFKDFYQASEGIYSRSKTRVRWYNETFNTEINPTLEIKIKKGNQNVKLNYKLNSLKTSDLFIIKNFKKNINICKLNNQYINFALGNLNMYLYVSYKRKYYKYKNIRITLDYNLSFLNVSRLFKFSNKNLIKRINTTILEMKFEDKNYLDANFFAKLLNKKIDKFSKYQIGMINTNFNLSNLIY